MTKKRSDNHLIKPDENVITTPDKKQFRLDRERVLGKGGHGEVVLGYELDRKTGAVLREVAVKIIKPSLLDINEEVAKERKNLEMCERFIGAVVLGALGDQYGYIFMDYYPGIDLMHYLYEVDETGSYTKEQQEYYKEKVKLIDLQKLRLVIITLEQVITFHKNNILHGDIKPANFVLDVRGRTSHWRTITLVDVGSIERRVDKEYFEDAIEAPLVVAGFKLPAKNAIEGTYGYMAPELIESGADGYSADVFATGVVLAEILTDTNFQANLALEFERDKHSIQHPQLSAASMRALLPDIFDQYDEANDIFARLIPFVRSLTMDSPSQRPKLKDIMAMLHSLKVMECKLRLVLQTVDSSRLRASSRPAIPSLLIPSFSEPTVICAPASGSTSPISPVTSPRSPSASARLSSSFGALPLTAIPRSASLFALSGIAHERSATRPGSERKVSPPRVTVVDSQSTEKQDKSADSAAKKEHKAEKRIRIRSFLTLQGKKQLEAPSSGLDGGSSKHSPR